MDARYVRAIAIVLRRSALLPCHGISRCGRHAMELKCLRNHIKLRTEKFTHRFPGADVRCFSICLMRLFFGVSNRR
jgi:hypothetical protein